MMRMGMIGIEYGEPQETISFIVLGEPSPEGSTRAFYIPKLKRTVTTHQNQSQLDAWRNRVATEAQNVLLGREWTSDRASAYTVDVDFVLPRPSSVPEHRRLRPTVKPDIDKLIRAVNDALAGILFPDDCQVVSIRVTKGYEGEQRPGAYIRVCRYVNVREKARRKARKKVAEEEDIPFDPRDD
jgi:Holliday junction resolvase RusA-like endonuclease